MQVLALDFDGVISDSAPECFIVALETYLEMEPGSRLDEAWRRIRAGGPLESAPIVRDDIYRKFLDILPLGNRSEDFAVALALIDRGARVEDQASYDRERDRLPAKFLERFHRRFYEIRYALYERDPAGWLRIVGPYPRFVEILRGRAADVELAIATAKDRASVERLLEAYALSDLIAADRLLDKEVGVSKRRHLEELLRRTGAPASEITFIDDKVNHLDSVAPLGVRCALAAWGYNGGREHALAVDRGYWVCGLEDVERQLFD